jgi:Ulp1 family protease
MNNKPANAASQIEFLVPECPKQTNTYDCGVFLIQFAENFLLVHI